MDQTDNARWPGNKFSIFEPVGEITPALYLGFSRSLPVNNFGMYFDLPEQTGAASGPGMIWEYWNGAGWQKLVAQDETQNLQLPGMISVLPESDSKALARFGQSLHWFRGRLKEDAPPNPPDLRALPRKVSTQGQADLAQAAFGLQRISAISLPPGF